MTDLTRYDAATLGAQIAAGEVTSTEVTQAHLDDARMARRIKEGAPGDRA